MDAERNRKDFIKNKENTEIILQKEQKIILEEEKIEEEYEAISLSKKKLSDDSLELERRKKELEEREKKFDQLVAARAKEEVKGIIEKARQHGNNKMANDIENEVNRYDKAIYNNQMVSQANSRDKFKNLGFGD